MRFVLCIAAANARQHMDMHVDMRCITYPKRLTAAVGFSNKLQIFFVDSLSSLVIVFVSGGSTQDDAVKRCEKVVGACEGRLNVCVDAVQVRKGAREGRD